MAESSGETEPTAKTADQLAVTSYLKHLRENAETEDVGNADALPLYFCVRDRNSSRIIGYLGVWILSIVVALGLSALFAIVNHYQPGPGSFLVIFVVLSIIMVDGLMAVQLCLVICLLRSGSLTVRFFASIASCIPSGLLITHNGQRIGFKPTEGIFDCRPILRIGLRLH